MESVARFFRRPDHHFFLFGPRGTGKTTWLRRNLPGAVFLDLLSPGEQRLYEARPERLRELLAPLPRPCILVVDEIQRVPALLSLIHQIIEDREGVRFVLTGSSSRKLKRSGVDLLGGRAWVRRMHPFMAAELGSAFSLERALEQGTVPLVWASPDPAESLRSYLGVYIREEVQAEGLVRDLGSFGRFVEAVSFSHGSLLNLAEVARECAVNRKTVEGYAEVLEDLLLSFRLPVFTRRARRQLVSHPKFYWFDSGVFRSARPSGPLDRPSELAGPALEGLVAQHLRAWNDLGG
ncbi:MAG: AAA family ATPase, partial [Candidatus Eremiobacterota bacterium]